MFYICKSSTVPYLRELDTVHAGVYCWLQFSISINNVVAFKNSTQTQNGTHIIEISFHRLLLGYFKVNTGYIKKVLFHISVWIWNNLRYYEFMVIKS